MSDGTSVRRFVWWTICRISTAGPLRALLLVLVVFAVSPSATALNATFSGSTLTVTGLTPSARTLVCWYGSTTALSGVESWDRHAMIARSTTSGTLDVPAQNSPVDSIWLVVDLSGGEYALATPPGGHPRPMRIAPFVTNDHRGLSVLRPGIQAIIVRAPLGAWSATATDGRASDGDGNGDGRTLLGLTQLTPIDDTPPGPAVLVPGDLVFAIYQPWMEYSLVKVDAGGPGAD